MNQRFYVGIDGGGSTCRARLTDMHGKVLGEGKAGPANTRLGFETTFNELLKAVQAALSRANMPGLPMDYLYVGAGLAGLTLPGDWLELAARTHPFAELTAESDAHIACLGAHNGGDGAIVILGTGAIGCLIRNSVSRTVGGWGFVVGDTGSGARAGQAAIRQSLLSYDGIIASTALTKAVLKRFDNVPEQAVVWAETAKPKDFGAFVPMILEHVEKGDPVGSFIMQEAAQGANNLLRALTKHGAKRISLLGGFSRFVEPWLADDMRQFLVQPQGDALDGALIMIREKTESNG